jgi:hypothetical protein
MRLNQEIEEALKAWRPTMGNQDDLDILKRVQDPIGKFRSLDKEQKFLLELIKKRLKEGAIKPSAK